MVGQTKKLAIFAFLLTFLIATASANITLTQQPKNVYNLDDKIEITASINPTNPVSDLLTIFLTCENGEIEAHKEFLYTETQIEKQITIPLTKEYINNIKGKCEIKYSIGQKQKKTISNEFKISNSINIKLQTNKEFNPGEKIEIEGSAIKENLKRANGIIEATLNGISTKEKIQNGTFTLNFEIPKNTKAGEHNLQIKAYEQNNNAEITNIKEETKTIKIKQVPTNIEIILEQKNIKAGDTLKGKVSLKDQTGEEIKGTAYVAIKNKNGEQIEQIKTETQKEFKYEIPYYELPSRWTIAVYSEDIINKLNFNILENKDISVNLVNKTLIIENKGNTIYNETINVKIGEQTLEVPTNLAIKEIVKYELKAPTGQYKIQVGDVEQIMALTGHAIKLEKITDTNSSSFKIISWVFLIGILSFVTFNFFKKVKNKKFFGKKAGKTKSKPLELNEVPQPEKLMNTKINAQISSSINGGKQNAPVGCISIKNYEETRFGKGGVRETMQKIANQIESKKGIIYQNKSNIFFIIPPTVTKSYQNELPAIEIMKYIQNELKEHNKKFKQKINYGLSLNYGTIVTSQTKDNFKFMSMGTLITTSKKLARMSTGQIIIGEKFYEKAKEKIKVQKLESEEIKAYELKSIKENLKDKSHTFITGFLERQAKEKQKK